MKAALTTAQFLERLDLAVKLRRSGCYDLAMKLAGGLIYGHEQEPALWHTIGQIETDRGKFDGEEGAIECHRFAFELLQKNGVPSKEQYQTIALGYAQAMMRQGSFEAALPLWEAGRLDVSWFPWPGTKYWNGREPESPESLLIQSEGGYGDTFMFMRWIPLLKERFGIKRLGFMAWKPLKDFCDWSRLGIDQFYAIGEDSVPFAGWGHSISIMSLPYVFGVKWWDEVRLPEPAVEPAFHEQFGISVANGETTYDIGLKGLARLMENTANTAKRIGFCWRAEENTSPVRTKSLPIEAAAKVTYELKRHGYDVFSLSPEKADLYNGGTFDQPPGLILEPSRMTDWKATVAYLQQMDFILTVDTAVAHLAGVLGIPTLVLLPKSSCWRWGMPGDLTRPTGEETSHWYGPELTLYRQRVPLDWDPEEILEFTHERLKAIDTIAQAKT